MRINKIIILFRVIFVVVVLILVLFIVVIAYTLKGMLRSALVFSCSIKGAIRLFT